LCVWRQQELRAGNPPNWEDAKYGRSSYYWRGITVTCGRRTTLLQHNM